MSFDIRRYRFEAFVAYCWFEFSWMFPERPTVSSVPECIFVVKKWAFKPCIWVALSRFVRDNKSFNWSDPISRSAGLNYLVKEKQDLTPEGKATYFP